MREDFIPLLRRRKAVISITGVIPISVTLLLSPLSLAPLLLLLLAPGGCRCGRPRGIHSPLRWCPLRRKPDGWLSGHRRRRTTGRGSDRFCLLGFWSVVVIAAALSIGSGGRNAEALMLVIHLLQRLDLRSVFFEEFQTTLVRDNAE